MQLRIGIAQTNPTIGAFTHNSQAIIGLQPDCDLLVCAEMALTGYPPQDLLLDNTFVRQAEQAAFALSQSLTMPCLLGSPLLASTDNKAQQNTTHILYNAAVVYSQGEQMYAYHKRHLPNESVFDEHRYFTRGAPEQPHWLWRIGETTVRVAVCVCQDIWHRQYIAHHAHGADVLMCLNASPFYCGRANERFLHLRTLARDLDVPVIYANCVGGQDELLFDGNSVAVNKQGEIVAHAAAWQETCMQLFYDTRACDLVAATTPNTTVNTRPNLLDVPVDTTERDMQDMLAAVCLGTRDYLHKTGNKAVWLGLSGGIDSALTAYIAARALGAEQVHAVMMPYKYTSELSVQDAQALANRLGIHYQTITIAPLVDAFYGLLHQQLADATEGARSVALQNIQARVRGMLLMTLANLTPRSLVLTTSNKSELSMGYSTLYGDMAGAFNPLKDINKTDVFALCRYINRECEIIPSSTITRPPSAELAPDQKDTDSLPAYDVLDAQLATLLDPLARAALGTKIDRNQQAVWQRVQQNEFKRFQSPPGVRISKSSLTNLEWRYPLVKKR